MYYEPVRTVKASNFRSDAPIFDFCRYCGLGLAVALRGNVQGQMKLMIILNPRTKSLLPILCYLHMDDHCLLDEIIFCCMQLLSGSFCAKRTYLSVNAEDTLLWIYLSYLNTEKQGYASSKDIGIALFVIHCCFIFFKWCLYKHL